MPSAAGMRHLRWCCRRQIEQLPATIAAVNAPLDLEQFVQRRQLTAYEQDMARGCYAYGVDLRRGSWFRNSAVAQTGMRSLELRWLRLADDLMASGELLYPAEHRLVDVLREIVELARMLHADVPALRLLSPKARQSGNWPVVTPLGNSHGSCNWLAVDPDALTGFSRNERRFLLGSALGHLQCGHGILFTSRLVTKRERSLGLIACMLRPWSKVAVFSADRAGMLAAGDLEASLMAVAAQAASEASYAPQFPGYSERRLALEDFEHTRVVARMRTQQTLVVARKRGAQPEGPEAAEAGTPEVAEPEAAEPAADPPETPAAAEQSEASDEQPRGVPRTAWPLARCDQRLTRRLGLL